MKALTGAILSTDRQKELYFGYRDWNPRSPEQRPEDNGEKEESFGRKQRFALDHLTLLVVSTDYYFPSPLHSLPFSTSEILEGLRRVWYYIVYRGRESLRERYNKTKQKPQHAL